MVSQAEVISKSYQLLVSDLISFFRDSMGPLNVTEKQKTLNLHISYRESWISSEMDPIEWSLWFISRKNSQRFESLFLNLFLLLGL